MQIGEGTTVNKVCVLRFEKSKENEKYAFIKQGVYKKVCFSKTHHDNKCLFKSAYCFIFHKLEFLKIRCRNRKFCAITVKTKYSKIKNVQEYSLNFIDDNSNDVLQGKPVKNWGVNIKVDFGTIHTIISKNVADKLFSDKPLLVKSNIKMQMQNYTRHSLNFIR